MRIEQNQVRVTQGLTSKTYTFDQSGHCEVRDGGGRWIAGGDADLGYSSIFHSVAFLYFDIDEQSLNNYMTMHPELGQRLQLDLHRAGREVIHAAA